MEYLKTYYSLEKHLEETIKFNHQFSILDSIWKLNKKNITNALSNINQYFPHYSLHDKSHSTTIINNIELFLGEDRIKRLSPTNTWLLLMASYTHDLGMVIFQDVIENEWEEELFQAYLDESCNSEDETICRSSKIICAFQKKEHNAEITPIDVKNAVTIVVAEYMRKIHHKRSSDILKGLDKRFLEVAKHFYSDQIPNRLLNLLGDIAYLHGVDFYDVIKTLDFESNGISNDKMNPRFIATMLRLGDLLDIDDGRFNDYTNEVFLAPKSSLDHKAKHSSIKHFLITPESIEITADCPNDEVYRLARSWFDYLEDEVENLNKEWSNVAPYDLGGGAPRIPKGKIKVFTNGSIIDDRFLNLKFQISNKKMFEILEGGAIYDKAEFTFLRELIQNSLDASKIQIWNEIKNGTYNFLFRQHFNDNTLKTEDILSKIVFPNDIPSGIMQSHKINLTIKWKDSKEKILVIVVEDEGTGISGSDLIRMTSKVAESRKSDLTYKKDLESMPFWLKPTGAFGVGLQSLFIITDVFKIRTKADGESGKEIIFRSAKNNKYCILKDLPAIRTRGTLVSLEIPENKFPQIFGTSFDWDTISKYDHFNDSYGNIYIHKIKNYIYETLRLIPNLNVNLIGDKLKISNEEEVLDEKWNLKSDNTQCNIITFDNRILFHFYEKISGSEFYLDFDDSEINDIKNIRNSVYTNYFVRNIPVNSNLINYNQLAFSGLTWNFMNTESDKILSLSREKFISKNKAEQEEKFLTKTLKEALNLLNKFPDQESMKDYNNNKEILAKIYFKILLTLKSNNVENIKENTTLLKFKVNKDFASKSNRKTITYNEFINSEELIIPMPNVISPDLKNIQEKEKLISSISSGPSIIIWCIEKLRYYLDVNYYINKIDYFENGHVLYLTKSNNDNKLEIKVGLKYYYTNFLYSHSLIYRKWNYCIGEEIYFNKLRVSNTRGSGFERFPFLSKDSIISPFSSQKQFDELYTSVESFDKNDLSKKITRIKVENIVTDSLIEWIIEHKPNNKSELTKDEIIDAYQSLIIDILLAKNTIDQNNQKP